MKRSSYMTLSAFALMLCMVGLTGCDQEIASSRETTIEDDGTVKTKEKTVTQDADGDTTITETETTRNPGDPN